MKKTSIKAFILSACEETEIDFLREMPLLSKWGKQIDQKIGAYNRYKKKIAVDTIKNCKISLPCDGVWLNWVVLGDHGCDCTQLYSTLNTGSLNYDELGYNDCQCYTWSDGNISTIGIEWVIKGDCVEFPGLNNKTITFEYLAYESDDEGFPIVYECHEDAVVNYIKYKLASRNIWKIKAAGGNPTALERERMHYKRLFRRGVRYAKGQHNYTNMSQTMQHGIQYQNELSGRGMSMIKPQY